MTGGDIAPPRLYSRTVAIPDPGDLLAHLPETDAYAWVRDGDGMVAWGEAARHKPTSVAEADQWWNHLVSQVVAVSQLEDRPAGAGFMAFGSFAFDPDNTSAHASLVVPRTIVGRRNGRSWLTQIDTSFRHDDLLAVPVPPRRPVGVRIEAAALGRAGWRAAVAEAVARIGDGALEKVVLARALEVTATEDLDPRWLVAQLAERYRRCWTFMVDGLVGATPEMLLRQEAGLATSRVLAGTIRRSGDNQRDLALAAALSRSSKDLEEHEYAVRSVAAALAPYCSGMNVPDAPYVLELPNVWHLATDVTAVADHGASSLVLASALHPSAAVCGTPTSAARETIAELEHLDRERYAGPVGWIDAAGDGEWAIALRCGRLDPTDSRRMRLYAGCGIVAGSDPDAELAEADAKFLPMCEALGAVSS